jgi:tetratricopeptide (TPR) repeat protein
LIVGLLALAGGALAWEQPKEWTDIGLVGKWKEYDSKFYRIYADAPFTDESQFKYDQVKIYAKTRQYNGKLDGIPLTDFLTRDEDEQKDRRKQAAKELKYVADFHMRMMTMVQRVKSGQGPGWGTSTQDQTVVANCLTKLRTAVGLDPSNPYAWHVLAYFAHTAGDLRRAAGALNGAQLALEQIPDDQLTELRSQVAMDRAWLQYDMGQYERAGTSLRVAVDHGYNGTEPRLLQGLIAAQMGDTQAAVEIANSLRSAEVKAFPPNLNTTSYSPDMANIDAWRTRTSNYLQSWILALTWLEEGNVDMAAAAFGQYSTDDQYPYAQRFWNDAGRIYELTGRRSLAHRAWSMARICNPYIVYMVYKPYASDMGILTGRPGAIPFFLGYDQFYMSGSKLAFGGALVQAIQAEEDEFKRQEMASFALEELELCQATGVYPGQVQVLKGQTYYLMGDLGSALLEVEGALEYMDKVGDKAGVTAVLQGLAKSDEDLAPQDVANFYSQRGTSGGRWLPEKNLDSKLAGLRQAYKDDPSDANRHELARFLIRHDDPDEGRALAMGALNGQQLSGENIRQLSGDDLALVLEADREEGNDELALALVRALEGGAEDPWNHAVLWIYAGFICMDVGDMAEAKFALERAQELDPGNQALKIQLALMEKGGQ